MTLVAVLRIYCKLAGAHDLPSSSPRERERVVAWARDNGEGEEWLRLKCILKAVPIGVAIGDRGKEAAYC